MSTPAVALRRLANGAPELPEQFQAKFRVDVQYKRLHRPMLGMVHYDFPNRRSREDYYYVHTDPPERFFTSIKLHEEGKNFMIFHRIRDPALPTPRGCMLGPITSPLPYPTLLNWASHRGNQMLTLRVNDDEPIDDASSYDVPVQHWRVKFDGTVYDLFASPATGHPIMLQRAGTNFTFLHFEAGPHTARPELFVPESVSSVRCTPVGG